MLGFFSGVLLAVIYRKQGPQVPVYEWLEEEEETTLKRFYNEGDRIRLQPENKTMEPIYVNPNNVKIMGRVVTVIRQLA